MSPLAFLAATAVLCGGQTNQLVAYTQPTPQKKLAATSLAEVDADYAFQGEYLGQVIAVDGTPVVFGLQVVALGDGQFSARGYQDGLPGNGWDRETVITWSGTREGPLLTFDGPRGRILVEGGAAMIIDAYGKAVGQVEKIRRVSATLGATPPAGAMVLFDGSNTDAFEDGKITDEGLLDVGALTRMAVEDFRLHLEFRLPYMPYARDQGRSNSGVYIQRRYEVQILDSFGLEPVFNGCAALYRQQPPDLNMSFPPLAWQTYDIYFTAARWDDEGNKISDARITVYHNGIAVHNDRIVPTKTGAGKKEGPEPLPILFQNHGNPVRFRNIWLVTGPESARSTAQAPAEPGAASEVALQAGDVVEPTAIPFAESCDCDTGYAETMTPYASFGQPFYDCANCPGQGGWVIWRAF